MQDILDTPPNIHKHARETEQLALEFILPKVKKLRLAVLKSIAKAGWPIGKTGSEIVDDIDGYIVSVRPRITELHEYGLIMPGNKRKNKRGCQELSWLITTQGEQVARMNDE
jgi:hypothetical protein